MWIKIYEYANCATCKSALKYADSKGLVYERVPIVEQPPSVAELKAMLGYLKDEGGSLKNLFNTSGQLYREMGVSEKIKAGLSEKEALKLLSKHGKLIKRPFLLTQKGGTVGFNQEVWRRLLK